MGKVVLGLHVHAAVASYTTSNCFHLCGITDAWHDDLCKSHSLTGMRAVEAIYMAGTATHALLDPLTLAEHSHFCQFHAVVIELQAVPTHTFQRAACKFHQISSKLQDTLADTRSTIWPS